MKSKGTFAITANHWTTFMIGFRIGRILGTKITLLKITKRKLSLPTK